MPNKSVHRISVSFQVLLSVIIGSFLCQKVMQVQDQVVEFVS